MQCPDFIDHAIQFFDHLAATYEWEPGWWRWNGDVRASWPIVTWNYCSLPCSF